MYRKPIICVANPDDKFFIWQCHLYVENCINVGFDEERIHILLYTPPGRKENTSWERLKDFYPKLNIYRYYDKGVGQYLGLYIPILRPHVLWQHFEANPWLKDELIIYTDCDILWTRKEPIEKYYDDNCCYVSDAKSYLNVDYFNSKIKDVLPEKIEEYKKRDVVQELCDIVGIDKQVAIDNNHNTGGVQYILKNIDADFWKKIERDVISIRKHLMAMNKELFASESKGYQSWCADLWALQYNLWDKGCCKTIPELSFLWVHDNRDRLETTNIYHNAGAVNTGTEDFPIFYKGKYHTGTNPFIDPHLDKVLNSPKSQKHCTWYYANEMDKLRKKYDINYL